MRSFTNQSHQEKKASPPRRSDAGRKDNANAQDKDQHITHSFGDVPLYAPPIQAKLAMDAPGDKHEQEADAIAAKAVSNEPVNTGITPVSSSHGNGIANPSLHERIASTKGSGNDLDGSAQASMESRLGADFSQVKVHTDSKAASMNREMRARAFTTGNDIYFNQGEYNPGSITGDRLLAHELTHVLQQSTSPATPLVQRAGMGDGHDLMSPRFAGTIKLEEAFDVGGPELKVGEIGMHVRIIQQALVDAGETVAGGVDGDFKANTETAIKNFQTHQGLVGADVTGTINPKTMELLDNYFADRGKLVSTPQSMVPATAPTQGVEWPVAGAPPELSQGTRSLKVWDKAEMERRRTTEVQAPPGGSLPNFKMNDGVHADTYEKRIHDATLAVVDRQYLKYGKDKAVDHANPAKLHAWSDIEKVAVVSKRETDRVFKNFAKGDPLVQGTNLHDAWDKKEAEFAAGGAPYEQSKVEWRVEKIIQDTRVTGGIDSDHGAVQSRTTLSPGESKAEATILKDVRDAIIAVRRPELIATHKGWPGFADPPTRSVFIQRFKGTTDAKNRDFMWEMFHTLIHEYIHTLAHSEYIKFYNSLGEQKGGRTYREGMTDYFAKMAIESTVIDPALRKDVEGPFHNPAITHPIIPYVGYPEAKNAEAVVGVAGLKNAMAAFFLGKVDLLGK